MKNKLLMIAPDTTDTHLMSKELWGLYDILFSTHINEAIIQLPTFSPTVALLDLRDKGIGDLEILDIVRSKENVCLPIVLIVAKNSLKLERSYRKLGDISYIVRPYGYNELSSALDASAKYSIHKRKEETQLINRDYKLNP